MAQPHCPYWRSGREENGLEPHRFPNTSLTLQRPRFENGSVRNMVGPCSANTVTAEPAIRFRLSRCPAVATPSRLRQCKRHARACRPLRIGIGPL